MPPKARFAERAQQVAQRLEAEEVETLVSNFKLGLLRLASLAANARLPRGIVRLVNRNVIFLLHALDEFLDKLIELPVRDHLFNLLAQVLVEHLPVHQRLLDGPL